jgi:hypothetical protein
MKKTIWTKANAMKMSSTEILKWLEKCTADLENGKRLEVKLPATEKAFKALQAAAIEKRLI